jgi:hypothetical protein
LETEQLREIDIHLAEYQALRSEMVYYIQRIDQTATFYITALFGILAFCLRPGSQFDSSYLARIVANPPLTALALLVPILNSLLLVRIGFLFLTMLTIAKYLNAVVTPRLSALIRSPVLCWDRADVTNGKKPMLLLRSISQYQSAALAEGISLYVLLVFRHGVNGRASLVVLYLLGWLGLLLSLTVFGLVLYAGRKFHSASVTVSGV